MCVAVCGAVASMCVLSSHVYPISLRDFVFCLFCTFSSTFGVFFFAAQCASAD